jgi:hypothetical protein
MPFAERYLNALNSSNLQDDELHKQTEIARGSRGWRTCRAARVSCSDPCFRA